MMHFKLSEIEFSIPTSWGELTYNQFMKLKSNDGELLSVISILSGIDKETWEQVKQLDIDAMVLPYLEFINEPMPIFILPDRIQYKGEYIALPGGIDINTLGQKISLERERRRIEKENIEEVEIYPFVASLYLQPIITNTPYDNDKVEALMSDMRELKINELFPLVNFFLRNYEKLSKKSLSTYLTHQRAKKSGQVLTGLESSESYQRFGLFRRPLAKLLMKFSLKGIRLYS